MASPEWSLQRELCELAGELSLAEALHHLGLVSAGVSFEIDDSAKWSRGGAETYIFPFSISTATTKRYIMKAMVAATPAVSPEQQLAHWLARRSLLVGAQVAVPNLYAAGSAVLVEDYIEDGAIERLKRTLLTSRPKSTD